MKKTILISAILVAIFFMACGSSSNSGNTSANDSLQQTFNLDTTQLKSGATFYQCPMHLEVISDKPGTCPKCKMDLVEMKKH